MKDLGVCMRHVGRFLLRCLVGKYGALLLTGMLALLVGAGAYVSLIYDNTGSSEADQGPVYSVAAVEANPAQDPELWLGRTIRVRGEFVPCIASPRVGDGPCAILSAGGEPEDGFMGPASSTVAALPVVRVGLDPWRSFWRRAPLLGRLIPAPQVPHWGVVATYTVRLAAVPNVFCGINECVEALLLDSAP
jgi:hypothetical protein